MEPQLTYVRTLIYFDGPQLFVAEDRIGTNYLCLIADEIDDVDQFLCMPLSSSRLREIEQGNLELRAAFLEPEIGDLYTGSERSANNTLTLTVSVDNEVPEDWYPQEGFFLDPVESIAAEARSRNRAVVSFALNPPESQEEMKIEVPRLTIGLQLFQRLVKHAYSRAISNVNSSTKELLSDADKYQLEVFSISPGSFTVNMQSKSSADLIGHVDLERSLKLVDEAVAASSDLEAASEFLRQNKGHFLNAYRKLLNFIVENNSPVGYRWSTPNNDVYGGNALSVETAQPLYEFLTLRQELTAEPVTLTGTFTKVDVERGYWTLRSQQEKKSFSGKTDSEGSILRGITADLDIYRVYCEERLEEISSTGEEKTQLFLVSFVKL